MPESRAAEAAIDLLASVRRQPSSSIPPAWFVVESATIAEVYVGDVLDRLFTATQSELRDHRIGSLLLKKTVGPSHKTWNDRKATLNELFKVNISGTKAGQQFDTLVALRNSLVHGHSRLTRIQSAQPGDAMKLLNLYSKVLHVQVSGAQLFLHQSTAIIAVDLAQAYVTALDRAVVKRYPAMLLA